MWRESLPDWQRETVEEADRKRAAITREARRRLGLPEEEGSMPDVDETPCDRYEAPFDGDEETRRVDAALDRIDARLVEMEARLDAIDDQLDRRLTTRQLGWWGLWVTLEVLVGFGLVVWRRAP
jgi:hypothetical protein